MAFVETADGKILFGDLLPVFALCLVGERDGGLDDGDDEICVGVCLLFDGREGGDALGVDLGLEGVCFVVASFGALGDVGWWFCCCCLRVG